MPSQYPVGVQQSGDLNGGIVGITTVQGGNSDITKPRPYQRVEDESLADFIIPGFYSLDQAMLQYFSNVKAVTKDSYRYVQMKIAGHDKTLDVWREDLSNGKAVFPVGAISRTTWNFNSEKFSPPYLPMSIRYTNQRGNMAALTYRPVPFLVDYTVTVWAEIKRDAEYALYQICTRFNPLAEFVMNDGHVRGTITMKMKQSADQSEKELSYEQHRIIKYEYTIVAEAWLPLPERLVPTVLGHVTVIKDQDGNVLLSNTGNMPGS